MIFCSFCLKSTLIICGNCKKSTQNIIIIKYVIRVLLYLETEKSRALTLRADENRHVLSCFNTTFAKQKSKYDTMRPTHSGSTFWIRKNNRTFQSKTATTCGNSGYNHQNTNKKTHLKPSLIERTDYLTYTIRADGNEKNRVKLKMNITLKKE